MLFGILLFKLDIAVRFLNIVVSIRQTLTVCIQYNNMLNIRVINIGTKLTIKKVPLYKIRT